SVFGIARDYAAAQARRYLQASAPAVTPTHGTVFPVSIEHTGCPVFGSRVIRGVNPAAKSPDWLRERLRRVGLNSISPIVEVTNDVMLDLGQPLHAYDSSRLVGARPGRALRPGERV